MNPRKISYLFFVLAAVACGHEGGPKSTPGNAAQPIINGDSLSSDPAEANALSLQSPAVSIRAIQQGQVIDILGSGVVIAPRVVLTAGHVVDVVRDFQANNPASVVTVTNGNLAVERSRSITRMGEIQGFRMNKQRISVGGVDVIFREVLSPDFGIMELDADFPGIQIPGLDCDPAPPSQLRCVSGTFHTVSSAGKAEARFGRTNRGVFRTAVFEGLSDLLFGGPTFLFGSVPWELKYLPNSFFLTPAQAAASGDSGMGCFDHNNLLEVNVSSIQSGVENTDTRGQNPLMNIGVTHLLRPPDSPTNAGATATARAICPWIKRQINPATRLAFAIGETQFAVSQVAGSTFVLEMDDPELGQQSFSMTVPAGLTELTAATIGNFDGRGASAALVGDGELFTASFDDGPEPTLTGSSANDYRAVAALRFNGDRFDDLFAQRADSTVDVYLGSADGLVLNEGIHPIPLKLDSDLTPDFAWVNGLAINTISSVVGPTTRNAISDNLVLKSVLAGRFRVLPNGDGGIHDLVVLAHIYNNPDNTVVFWCKATTGGGVGCEPALDATFATGRIPRDMEVFDFNSDGLHDLRLSYASGPERIILAGPEGFKPLSSQGLATPVRRVQPLLVATDLNTVAFNDTGGNIIVSTFDTEIDLVFGPFDTGIPFEEPFLSAIGNFNDDGVIPTTSSALAEGAFPFHDVAVLSGGRLLVLTSNGDGTFTLNTPSDATGFVDLAIGDVTGDGIDDIQGAKSDGSVTVYAGIPGSGQGVDLVGQNFTGLPTPDGNDGKMLVLSGLGVDTVGATEARLKLSVGTGDTLALEQLTVQVFDGDNGGLHQFEEETSILKTCYRLVTDPCGDGNAGNCAGGPTTPVELVTASSDTLRDDVWDTIFDGEHSEFASFAGDGNPPYTYELRVYLSEDCAVLPAPDATIPVATADAFKVRSNALVSHAIGELSFIGSDSEGEFGLPGLPYLRDTEYDGSFSLPIAVGVDANEIQLMEADADDTQDATPGVSTGANSEVQYRLLMPDGTTQALLVGAEDTAGTEVVVNPSGNNDGIADLDVETRTHTIESPAPGTWFWQWDGVMATNAIHVFAPFGSPTTFEIMGAQRVRPTLSTALPAYFWEENQDELSEYLPIVLGHALAGDLLEGNSVIASNLAEARAVLENGELTLEGELRRQLLVAKLNAARGLSVGEDLRGALVYGTTTPVSSAFRLADDAAAGVDIRLGDHEKAYAVQLLSSVNLGELTYQHPTVPFPAEPMEDEDGDGIVNMKDNCPPISNPLQESSFDDRIGDACRLQPIVGCVLKRSEGMLEAFFAYDNPLTFRSIPAGSRNAVWGDTATKLDQGQPVVFEGGLSTGAFSVQFPADETLAWSLEGSVVEASIDSVMCSGRELTRVDFAQQVALFATDWMVIGERSTVRAPDGQASIVSNGDILVGSGSVVGHLFTGASARLESHSSVRGSAVTVSGIEKQGSALVSGARIEAGALRRHSLDWLVDFEKNLPAVQISEGEQVYLAPGAYGSVAVPARAQLVLDEGHYQLQALEVDEQATVVVRTNDVIVHIESILRHHGETRVIGDASFVIGYFGVEQALVDASFDGTLVAPHADVVLGAAGNAVYTGTFFARGIELRPGSVVDFALR